VITYFKSKAGVLSEVLDPDHALESASAWSSDAEQEGGFENVMAFAIRSAFVGVLGRLARQTISNEMFVVEQPVHSKPR